MDLQKSNDISSELPSTPQSEDTHNDPPGVISVEDGLSDLRKMREMLSYADEKELEAYISTVRGALDRRDLEQFLEVLDKLSYIPLVEGDITEIWWNCENPKQNVPMLVTMVGDDEWFRLEYQVNAYQSGVPIEEQIKERFSTYTLLEEPVQSKDGRITVYAEFRENHKAGDFAQWIADIDGIFTNIVYKTTTPLDSIDTEEMFLDLTPVTLKSLTGG
ncbi:MAG: hypothetical protein E7616_08295 [Ruminococcaceae bacterium]|nr:hypothetical protein [Oscillospiraceae bacterium]